MTINIFVLQGDLNGENRSGAFLILPGIVLRKAPCIGHGSGCVSQQDPIDDAFVYTSVPTCLSNRADPPLTLRQASRSQNQPSASSQLGLQAPKLRFYLANGVEPISQIQMRRAIWIQPARRQNNG